MMLRRNVLIFHQGALGDFVLTWPTALAASRIFPQSRIVYVTAKSKGQLAETVLRVESADIEAGWHRLFEVNVALDGLTDNVQRLLNGAHTAIDFSPAPGSGTSATLQRLREDVRIIHLNTSAVAGMHQGDRYVAELEPIKPLAEATRQILSVIRTRAIAFNRKPEIDVLIHPGSGGAAKRWPLNCFLELAQQLQVSGRSCRFVIGEVEREQWSSAERAAVADVAQIREPTTYVELLREIAEAKRFVGNDSGPAHLAAIIGTPTVAMFGPTDPAVWSPVGPNVVVIHRQSIDSITAAMVISALESLPI